MSKRWRSEGGLDTRAPSSSSGRWRASIFSLHTSTTTLELGLEYDYMDDGQSERGADTAEWRCALACCRLAGF